MARRKEQDESNDRLILNLLVLGGLVWVKSSQNGFGKPPEVEAETSIEPVTVYGGERVCADSYRRIKGRRKGMDYTYAEGHLGGRITFDVRRNGVFTRNVILENGVLFAELKYI